MSSYSTGTVKAYDMGQQESVSGDNVGGDYYCHRCATYRLSAMVVSSSNQ
ncbi:hypothetical protein [Yersinia wautersii]|nr:hypothetical protein [Yersinia wautersii]